MGVDSKRLYKRLGGLTDILSDLGRRAEVNNPQRTNVRLVSAAILPWLGRAGVNLHSVSWTHADAGWTGMVDGTKLKGYSKRGQARKKMLLLQFSAFGCTYRGKLGYAY